MEAHHVLSINPAIKVMRDIQVDIALVVFVFGVH